MTRHETRRAAVVASRPNRSGSVSWPLSFVAMNGQSGSSGDVEWDFAFVDELVPRREPSGVVERDFDFDPLDEVPADRARHRRPARADAGLGFDELSDHRPTPREPDFDFDFVSGGSQRAEGEQHGARHGREPVGDVGERLLGRVP